MSDGVPDQTPSLHHSSALDTWLVHIQGQTQCVSDRNRYPVGGSRWKLYTDQLTALDVIGFIVSGTKCARTTEIGTC